MFFLFFIIFLCCVLNYLCCKDYKVLLRVGVFVVNWFVIILLYMVCILLCENVDLVYNCIFMVYFKCYVVFCGLGVVLYVVRVLECLMVGVFDNFG